MTRKSLFFSVLPFLAIFSAVGSPDTVRFVNAGKMAVAVRGSTGKSSLVVPQAVWMAGNSSVRQDGVTSIGGNFYHNATTNVFYKTGDQFTSSGKMVFFRNNGAGDTGGCRYVTVKSGNIDAFNRGANFIAFPEVEIRTKDTLVIPAKMGIDALRLVRDVATYGSDIGKLWLKSKAINEGSGDRSYDASLRITGSMTATSEELVPPGSVIIERDLTPYRVEDGATGAGPLFAFASPFKSQRSGYFAGNWLRKMLEDASNNSHVEFVYGNKRGGDQVILTEQYIINPAETFAPGKGYLVKLRKQGYDYSLLTGSGGLAISGSNAGDYDASKFVFNGKPYTMADVDEQVFADSILFKRSINLGANVSPTYINWIIGNSWTAPIDIDALVDLMGNSPLMFEPFIYVFPYGSTNYQVYKCTGANPNSMTVIDIDEIPAMSYFMVRLDKTKAQNGTFTLRRNELLMHGNASHSSLRSAAPVYSNEVLFRVSPESNPNIYDLAGVGLRRNGNPNTDSKDILKTGGDEGGELFGLYSLSGDGKKLSANIVPEDADSVPLCFSPGTSSGRFKLEATRLESLSTEGLWLEDVKEGTVTDLLQSGGSYTFNVLPEDEANRFIVHFKDVSGANTGMADAGVETWRALPLHVTHANDEIIITGLQQPDAGSQIIITDAQGRTLLKEILPANVGETGKITYPLPLSSGVYVASLLGRRSITLKFGR